MAYDGKIESNDIIFSSLELRKIDDPEKTLQIYPMETDRDIFLTLNISEDIFSPMGVSGLLHIKEPSSISEDFKINGSEYLHIEFENPTVNGAKKTVDFCITDFVLLGNQTDSAIQGISARTSTIALSFASCESHYLDRGDWINNASFMNNDMFSKIAGGRRVGGLVDSLAESYFDKGATKFSKSANDMDIEETKNSIWLKSNQLMYPWGKDTEPPSLLQLMNNLAENATTKDLNGCNFLFWQDLNGWHFKSVNKLIAEGSDIPKSGGEIPSTSKRYIYYIGDGMSSSEESKGKGDPKVINFGSFSEYEHYKMWQNGGYASYYESMKPDYSDPYFDFLDFESVHTTNIIDYNYHRDAAEWPKIEKYKVLPDSIKTNINKSNPNRALRIHDENNLYGYFSPPYNTNNPKSHDFIASVNEDGKFGKTNDILWQTMFDQTKLKISKCRTIQVNIKKGSESYIQVKNLKKKWDIYRHTICCDKFNEKRAQFFAVIDDAKLIQDDDRGGIYEYSWREVELWPTDIVDTLGDSEIEPEIISPPNAPISIVIVENGMSGVAEEIDGAFNINELMNVRDLDDVFVGPGVNVADGDFNDYPEAYQMMPVGGYFREGDDPCLIDHEDDEVHFHKHIVQMYRIPGHMLNTIKPKESTEELEIPEDVFFFDVQNAHDGLCNCIVASTPPPESPPFS